MYVVYYLQRMTLSFMFLLFHMSLNSIGTMLNSHSDIDIFSSFLILTGTKLIFLHSFTLII